MEIGNNFLEFSARTGDVATTLEALRIFRWLGQGERLSVKNRVKRVYEIAKATSKEYGVPLSVSGDWSSAVLPSAVDYEAKQYLKVRNQNN
jgi:hypothetical protein